jgi:glyceraldehyde 3-phosphate dehydrogenase
MHGVLATSTAPVVSSDLVGAPASSTVDLPLTDVVSETLVKVVTWYDNEWGFSNRMLDLTRKLVAAGA